MSAYLIVNSGVKDKEAIKAYRDKESVHALFNDPEYLPMKELRQRIADTRIVVVDGCD